MCTFRIFIEMEGIFLLLFYFIQFSKSDSFTRELPFVPIFYTHPETNHQLIYDFFDFRHLNNSLSSTKTLKKCMEIFHNVELNSIDSSKCMKDLESLAEKEKNGDSYFLLGTIHEYGLFLNKMNDTLARHFYKCGSRIGHYECQSSYAFFLRYGFGGKENQSKANALTKAARKNESITSILQMSSDLFYTNINSSTACHNSYRLLEPLARIVLNNLSYFRKSSFKEITRLSAKSLPKDKSDEEIIFQNIIKKKAEERTPENFISLANFYLRDRKPNILQAISILEEAINRKIPNAKSLLAILYLEGIFVEKNEELGEKLLVEAYTDSEPVAMTEVWATYLLQNDRNHNHDYYKDTSFYALSLLNKRNSNQQQNEQKNEKNNNNNNEINFFDLNHHKQIEIAVNGLNQIIKHGDPSSLYYCGLLLTEGSASLKKNHLYAMIYFQKALSLQNLPVIFTRAALSYRNVVYKDHNCENSWKDLHLFCELSFLFDDSKLAYKAIYHHDLEYALRIYQRLADLGSETSAWNAEVLCEHLKLNSSIWIYLQVKKQNENATRRLVEKQKKEGKIDYAINTMKNIAKLTPKDTFSYAMLIRKKNFTECLISLNHSKQMVNGSELAVTLTLGYLFIENLPQTLLSILTFNFKNSDVDQFIFEYLHMIVHIFIIFITLLLIYVILGMRLQSLNGYDAK
ncbi:hypothetical protein TRFO_09101 [Tritrichomonas foetus]|uniref:Uncharacterized protein n=1 Tax=Tritrichomonas foetus TaxID=1144522 RepID=A0A1J4JFH1_9EUKA|nr:hypothetical protein TRFO_09101 [Tritrichomonas foetus]|eukprot:OHS97966.1 hypothetical protein TRFO_09101 [Tritrichomonas foetus]